MIKRHGLGRYVFWLTFAGIWLLLIKSKRTRIAIFHGNDILVVKSWLENGKWSLPGGGVRKNESVRHAIQRELQEEVGVLLSSRQMTHRGSRTYHQNGIRFSYDLFTASVRQKPRIHISRREILAAQWVAIDTLTKHDANDDVIQAARLAK